MRDIVILAMAASVLFAGCAGRTANPIPVYLPGDENRSCEGLQTEMAQLHADMERIMPHTDKLGYNAVCATAGVFFIVPFFFMDFKNADKIEWEALRNWYNHLLIYAVEKKCDFGGKGVPDRILSPKEAAELAKEKAKEQKQQPTEE
jgi:hypothetical protein